MRLKRSRTIVTTKLSFANVTSFLALFIALSGSAYAAFRLPANSVGTKQLKNGAVTRPKLARKAVDSSKVVPGSLTGADIKAGSITGANINLATLGKVPSAATADTASAAPIAKVLIVTASGTSSLGGSGGSVVAATATCPAGTVVLGGGAHLSSQITQSLNDSYPSANNAWTADVFSFSGGPGAPTFTVYAVCAPAAATG